MTPSPRRSWQLLMVIGPGMLVAATGVGAGDLATAAFTGARLGPAVLWAVVVGAAMKYVLTERIAHWQLSTGESLLASVARRFRVLSALLFLPYLLLWSFLVGSALASACGVAMHALWPVFDDPVRGKVVFGVVHSLAGGALILWGGFRLFEAVMSACIALMFVTVLTTAGFFWPGAGPFFQGLLVPQRELFSGPSLEWTVALIGGVGGTVTLLCYGYWIREKQRLDLRHLAVCRIDLAVGYAMTALFGISMVIIGSEVEVTESGATLIADLAEKLREPLGAPGVWIFKLGAFGAIFSSLLGVWQSVPALFQDYCSALVGRGDEATTRDRSKLYRGYLLALSVVPMLGLVGKFEAMQKLYSLVGAAFLPLLALCLLALPSGQRSADPRARRGLLPTAGLVITLLFFALVLVRAL